jgi:hypothetical protein
MFQSFLTSSPPFNTIFDDATAKDFYLNVRCGLIHDARTKGGWRIRVCQSTPQAIDTVSKIVYRNKLQAAFDEFSQWYGSRLLQCADMKVAFVRKFDSLCAD